MRTPQTPLPSSFAEKRAVLLQMVRYAIAGGIITVLVAGSYWAGATWLHLDPNLSLAIVFVFFSLVSYFVHGAFSFKGHGERDRQTVRAGRFMLVNILGFLLNQFFVWLLVKRLHGATWWPVPPIIAFTPLVTFALHRRWVYA